MKKRKRRALWRPRATRDFDPEMVDRAIDAALEAGPDRARELAERASSEDEAEVLRLVATIREIVTSRPVMPESRVAEIVADLQNRSPAEPSPSWKQRWIELWSRDILLVGLGTGLGIGFGLMSLDAVAASAPGNRIAAALVAIVCAWVSVLLHRRAVVRERLASG
ncbi:MAG: hypothetical protein F4187_06935 [Gemmatimonadetes bacterium]|nr:hypothetical protein [Gemmatimonadota bacterium]MYI05865.1 hypothetical protein [Gemmatimonadota bacterium]